MKRILAFYLLGLLAATTAFAGNSVNNGGGVICINGQCKTLIEAGLEVKPEYEGIWLPSGELIKAVHSKLSLMPFNEYVKNQLAARILGRLDQFRKADIVDPSKLEDIKKLYIDIAADAGFTIDPSTFELVAFSSDDTMKPALSFILPKFFELNPDQQAAILIHEGLYRGQPTSKLRYVLQFENAMKDSQLGIIEMKINGQIAAHHLGVLNKGQLLGHMLLTVNSQQGTQGVGFPYFDQNLLGSYEVDFNAGKMILNLDINKILKLGEVEPRIPYALSKVDTLEFENKNIHVMSGKEDVFGLDNKGALSFYYYSERYKTYYQFELVNPEKLDLLLPN